MIKNKYKLLALVAFVCAVTGITIAYSALTQNLEIMGQARIDKMNWDVKFENLSAAQIVGDAEVKRSPLLTSAKIYDFDVIFKAPNSEISYTFDITNNGDIDAKVSHYGKSSITCVGEGTTKVADEAIVCGNVEFSLKYVSNGAEIALDDELDASESKEVKMTLKYVGSALPTGRVRLTDLGALITYKQK